MGPQGRPLASLRAWRDYFSNANVYGADIDTEILKNEERIKTYYVDQTNAVSISELFKNIGNINFDIIIDDGLHEYSANICLFENSFEFLSKKGIYIIEDVFFKDKKKFFEYFKNRNYNFSVIDIFHENNISNNCLIIIYKF
jgi:methylase of polypeptide subunit release factors